MKFLISLICVLGLYQSASATILRSAYKSNLCMDVNRGERDNWRYETNVEVWPCHGEDNQQFSLTPVAINGVDNNFSIQTLGRCLDIDMGYSDSWTHHNNVQLYSCNGGVNQQFRLEPQGDGWFTIRSMFDGRCLDIDLNTADGWRYERNVQLWTCTASSNQLWKFDAVDDDIIVRPIY